MFQNPFSFEGRIRRTEYGLSFLVLVFARLFTSLIALSMSGGDLVAANIINFIFMLPFMFFAFAQGAKRCHDLGLSGWYQLIPFFPLYMIFGSGDLNSNKYGANPKLKTINF